MPILDEKVSALVATLNIGHLSQEEQDDIINALGEVALKRVLFTVFDRLPEGEREPFQLLIEKDDQEGIQKVFAQYVPDIAELTQAAIEDTVEEHKRLVAAEVGVAA